VRYGGFKVFISENLYFIDTIGQVNVEFVEREATLQFLSSVFSYILLDYRFRILFLFLGYSVSSTLGRLVTTGFTRPTYSPKLAGALITSRST